MMENLSETILLWFENPLIKRVSLVAIGIVIILLIGNFIKNGINRTIKDTDSRYRARKTVNFLAYFFMLILLLVIYRDKLGSMGVALGVAGAGIAFALQEVIMSLAGWLYVALSGVVGIGQRVKVGQIRGDIIDIGVMTTTIMESGDWVTGDLYNGRIITLANSYIFKEIVHNYSAEYPFLWDEIKVPIRTDSDHHLARKIFTQVLVETCSDYASKSEVQWKKMANKFRVEKAQVQPMVSLEFDENWITFTLRYVVDYKTRRTTKDIISTRLLDEIAKNPSIVIATTAMEVTTVPKKI